MSEYAYRRGIQTWVEFALDKKGRKKEFIPSEDTKIKEASLPGEPVNKWVHVSSVGESLNGDVITEEFLQKYIEDFYSFDYSGVVLLGHQDYESPQGAPEPPAAAYVRALELKDGQLWALYEYLDSTWQNVAAGGYRFNSIFGTGYYDKESNLLSVQFESIAITNKPAVDGLQSMVLQKQRTSTNSRKAYLLVSRRMENNMGQNKVTQKPVEKKETVLELTPEEKANLKDELKSELLDELQGDQTKKEEEEAATTKDSVVEQEGEEEDGDLLPSLEELEAGILDTTKQLVGAPEMTLEEALSVALQLLQDQLAALNADNSSENSDDALMEDAVAVSRATKILISKIKEESDNDKMSAEEKKLLATLKKENLELKTQLLKSTVENDVKAKGASEEAIEGLILVLNTAGKEAYEKLLNSLVATNPEQKKKDMVHKRTQIESTVTSDSADDLNESKEEDEDEFLAKFRKAFRTVSQ